MQALRSGSFPQKFTFFAVDFTSELDENHAEAM